MTAVTLSGPPPSSARPIESSDDRAEIRFGQPLLQLRIGDDACQPVRAQEEPVAGPQVVAVDVDRPPRRPRRRRA